RRGEQRRALRRGGVGEGGFGRDRAALGRGDRGQRGAGGGAGEDQPGPLRRGLAGAGAARRPRRGGVAAGRRRLPRAAGLLTPARAEPFPSLSRVSRYTAATDADRAEMLDAIGVSSTEELFEQIPEPLRLRRPLDLPPGMGEAEVYERLRELAERNVDAEREVCFIG